MGCYALTIIVLGSLIVLPLRTSGASGFQAHGLNPESAVQAEASLPTLQFTVVAPAHEAATSLLAPFGPGFERELVAEFCKNMQCDVRWVQAANHDEALDMLRQGKADVAVGFQGDDMRTHAGSGVVVGPVYSHSKQVEIYTNAARLLESKFQVTDDVASASDVPASDVPALPNLDEPSYRLDSRSWSLWQPFAVLLDDAKDGKDAKDVKTGIVSKVGAGNNGIQSASAGSSNFHWAWRTYHPSLNVRLNAFWQRLQSPRDATLAHLEDRYYSYLPESVNPYSVADLMHILQRRLPRYSSIIAKASDRADINPLLFTAVIIQESRLDEGTVSHTGVRGIMQLTQNTANYLKVDRMDPVQAIGAGARYLNMLWQDLEALELDVWDRWFFTLAAFNQGPRRLEGAMELSRKLGGTGRTWSELKNIYPLLTQQKYADMIGQNAFRGQEAVNFVERVRMSYHILRGLVALERPEAENLAPLLRGFDVSALGF